MGWLTKLLGASSTQAVVDAPALPDGSTGRFFRGIVGESHYQAAIRRALRGAVPTGDGRMAFELRVEREPDNRYDENAIRIANRHGQTVGYLPRDFARKFRKSVEKVGGSVRCRGVASKGDEGFYGVWIDLCDWWQIPGVKTAAKPET